MPTAKKISKHWYLFSYLGMKWPNHMATWLDDPTIQPPQPWGCPHQRIWFSPSPWPTEGLVVPRRHVWDHHFSREIHYPLAPPISLLDLNLVISTNRTTGAKSWDMLILQMWQLDNEVEWEIHDDDNDQNDSERCFRRTSRGLYISQVIRNLKETRLCKTCRFNTEKATLTPHKLPDSTCCSNILRSHSGGTTPAWQGHSWFLRCPHEVHSCMKGINVELLQFPRKWIPCKCHQ